MWQLALIDCLLPFHLQKYSPLFGSYLKRNTRLEIKKPSMAQWLVYLFLDPAAPGLIPSIPKKKFKGKIVNVAAVNQQR